jgi:hypothetical protein
MCEAGACDAYDDGDACPDDGDGAGAVHQPAAAAAAADAHQSGADSSHASPPLCHRVGSISVLPRGRNFGRKPQKGPLKNLRGQKYWRPNFYKIYKKGPKRGQLF